MSGKRKGKETKAQANKKQKEEAAMMTSGGSMGASIPSQNSYEFKRLLVNTPVENLAYKKPKGVVYFVERDDKIKEVLKGLINQGFLSVPVLQKTGNKWYGFVDLADIVHFYVDNFGDAIGAKGGELWDRIAEKQGYLDKTVDDVMKNPRSRSNPFHPVKVGYSLFSAVEALAREEHLHRVPVIDENRNLKSVLTQSQVVQFVYENIPLLGSIKDRKVGNMKNVFKEVKTIDENTPAIKGFQLMADNSITGIAILDKDGRVVDNLSLSDLKTIRLETQLFHRLFYAAKDFLRIQSDESGLEQKDVRPVYRKVVRENDTIEHVIKVLVEYKIHRVYLVDDTDKPLGVVALRDVLLELISIQD